MKNSINKKVWGEHLILNLSECNLKAVTNPQLIEEFSKVLVKKIEMVPYGEPQIIHFGANDSQTAGWTLLQFIETSNIMAHFCDNGSAYIDIFSCKPFDPQTAMLIVQDYFEPAEMASLMLQRSPTNFSFKQNIGIPPFKMVH